MKILSVIAFLIVFNIANAQDTTCKKIERTTITMRTGKMGETTEKPGFKVGSFDDGRKFGAFYKNMKPYIWCTPSAQSEFKKANMCSGIKTGFIVLLLATGYWIGSVPREAGSTPVLPVVAGLACGGGALISYVFQRKHIKKSIEIHNSSLQK